MNLNFYLSRFFKNLMFAIITLNIFIGCNDKTSEKGQEQNQEQNQKQNQEEHPITEEKPKPLDGTWDILMIQGVREEEQKVFSQYFTNHRRSKQYQYKTDYERKWEYPRGSYDVRKPVYGSDLLSLTFYFNRENAELRFKNIDPDHKHINFSLPLKVNYLDYDQISIEANSEIRLTNEDRKFFEHWGKIGDFPFKFSPYPENLDWSHSLSGSYQVLIILNKFTITEFGKGIII